MKRAVDPAQLEPTLLAAALLARDARLGITVMVPSHPDAERRAGLVAEEAGVDAYCSAAGPYLAVRFVARHQDRRAEPPPLPAGDGAAAPARTSVAAARDYYAPSQPNERTAPAARSRQPDRHDEPERDRGGVHLHVEGPGAL